MKLTPLDASVALSAMRTIGTRVFCDPGAPLWEECEGLYARAENALDPLFAKPLMSQTEVDDSLLSDLLPVLMAVYWEFRGDSEFETLTGYCTCLLRRLISLLQLGLGGQPFYGQEKGCGTK